VSSAYLRMKTRVAEEKHLVRRVRRVEEILTKSKQQTPFDFSFFDLTKALMIDTAVQSN
jgi:hypothetical protein